MIRAGLVSVTFRRLDPAEVVELVHRAELDAIEWGGDVHVPHGDLSAAEVVGTMTRDAGVDVAAYGSYYRVGVSPDEGLPFEPVLESAPMIRVWPGQVASREADAGYRRRVVDDSRRIAALAADAGLSVSYEYHANSLTDTADSALRLLTEVDRPRVHTLWQPPVGADTETCLRELRAVLPWLTNVHVFHVWPAVTDRHPLAAGQDRWRRYLSLLASSGRDHTALLEFVQDSDPAAFLEDAATLRSWLAEDL
jgi:sugar phosphate isomerase/epimerase